MSARTIQSIVTKAAAVALALGIAAFSAAPAFAAQAPADGTYTVDVELAGGSGRSTVESPATLEVAGGQMTATIVWSSSNYDLMVVDGVEYQPTTVEGGSTFEIPVSALDEALPVSAETLAMGSPHMIDYPLTLVSASVLGEGGGAPVAAIVGGAAAVVAVIVVVAVVLRGRAKRGGENA